jgi:drug/metabolite transporter (DMT)-like permease
MTPTNPKRSTYLALAALLLLALVWGYNWVVMKEAMRYSEPFTFAALRNFLGALALLALVAARRGTLRPKAFWMTALFGFMQTSLSALPLWALYLGSAGKVSVLNYTMPFWLLLIAWPLLGERIHGLQWVAVACAMAGLIFVLDPWRLRGVAASLLAIGGGITWALASVLFKIIRRRHQVDLLSFTAWQALLGSIPLVVVALLTATEVPDWTAGFLAALVYNVVIASAVAWVLWLYILHTLPAGMAGISSLAIPVVGVLSAWIQLGERPSALEAAGMGLIVAALAILTGRGLRLSRQAVMPARAAPPEAAEAAVEGRAEPPEAAQILPKPPEAAVEVQKV